MSACARARVFCIDSNCAKTCGKCPSGVKQGTNDEAAIKMKAEDEAAAKKERNRNKATKRKTKNMLKKTKTASQKRVNNGDTKINIK